MSNTTATALVSHFDQIASTPEALDLLRQLQKHSPTIATATSLKDVAAAMCRDQTCDALWAPVITAAQRGNDLATLTLLRALLPRLCHLAQRTSLRHTANDPDEATSLAIHGVLEELRRYRLERRSNHGHQMRLASVKRITRDGAHHISGQRVREEAVGLHHDWHHTALHATEHQPPTRASRYAVIEELDSVARLLRQALEDRVITASEAKLLAQLYAGPERGVTDLADEATTRARLRKRQSRALAKLRDALTGPMSPSVAEWLNAA